MLNIRQRPAKNGLEPATFNPFSERFNLVYFQASFKGLFMVVIQEFYKALSEQLGLERQK